MNNTAAKEQERVELLQVKKKIFHEIVSKIFIEKKTYEFGLWKLLELKCIWQLNCESQFNTFHKSKRK